MLDKTDLIVPSRRGILLGLSALIAAPAVIRVAKLMPIKVYAEEIPIAINTDMRRLVPLSRYTVRLERVLGMNDNLSYYDIANERPLGGFVEQHEVEATNGILGALPSYKETLVITSISSQLSLEFHEAVDAAQMGNGLVDVGGNKYSVREITREYMYDEIETWPHGAAKDGVRWT